MIPNKKCFDRFLSLKENCSLKWAAIVGGVLVLISGCGHFEGTPQTFDEVRKQALGQEELFLHPRPEVLKAMVFHLKSREFEITRIEYLEKKALILGHRGDIEIEVLMIPALSGGTRLTTRVTRKDQWADYAWVKTLYGDTQAFLDRKEPVNWRQLTEGMLPVHPRPVKDSAPIGFLSPGSRVDLMEKEGTWGKIWLVAGGVGYVPCHGLAPDPPNPDVRAM